MDFSRRKSLLLAIAIIFCFNLNRTCAQNSTVIIKPLNYHVPIIPILTTNIPSGPKKFERIIVPVDSTTPLRNRTREKKKSAVSEKKEKEESIEKKARSSTVKPKDFDDGKGNFQKSFSYVNRKDEHGKIPTNTKPNDIQPLHISTRGYRTRMPEKASESDLEKMKKVKEQQEKLKVENLPEEPYRVPEMTWWDNIRQYNYGIIHDNVENLDKIPTLSEVEQGSLTDAHEVESKEMITPAVVMEPVTPVVQHHQQTVVHHEPSIINTHNPLVRFKSSFKNPNAQPEVHQRSDNPGRFLYKTQVYYPNYRDHIYLPITTYYGDHRGLAKVLPIFNSQTIHHNVPHHSTSPSPPSNHHKPNHIHQKRPYKHEASVVPNKIHPSPQAYIPPQKKAPMPRKPSEKPPPPKEDEEESDDYEDYDEADDGEGEEEEDGGKKQYQEESGEGENGSDEGVDEDEDDEEDDEEEEEDEKKPKYRYDSFRNRDSDESAEGDQFDLAWKKYGYGPKTAGSDEEEDSYESSESQIVPERKKIVLMKMQYFTSPHKGMDDLVESSSSNVGKLSINPKKDTETINIDKKNKRKKRRKSNDGDKSQKQHPNAGPDDLKFFQYFSYLGNGEHRAGGRSGNDKHYIEQHERGNQKTGQFQKKIVWADKHGGYGQHYYDLNHGG